MKRNFVTATRVGEPVESGQPEAIAHRYVGRAGASVVVLRDARGRLLPGSALVLLRADDCSEPRSRYSVVRRALGVPTKWSKRKGMGNE